MLSVLLAWPARSQERAAPDITGLGFAEHLYAEQDHYRAITEYRRLLFHFPTTRHGDAARKAVAACYIAAERWDDAEGWLTELEGRAAGTPLRRWATFEKASARFAAGRFEAAASAYDEFATDYAKAPETDTARWRGAWALLLAHRFGRAEAAFRAIGAPSRHANAAGKLAEECHRHGIRMLASIRMQLTLYDESEFRAAGGAYYNCHMTKDFHNRTNRNLDYSLEAESKRAGQSGVNLDYSFPEVRDLILAPCKEIAAFELNFIRGGIPFESHEADGKAPIMTAFFGEVQGLLKESAKRQRKELGANCSR